MHVTDTVADTALALQLARTRLLEAQELAGMISLDWMVDGDRVEWSRSPLFLLGPEPPGGYPVYREMVHPDDRAAWVADRSTALAATSPIRYADYRLVRTDGALRWISCTQRPPETVGGVRHSIFTLLDITDRKQAEFALAQSEMRLRELAHGLERQVEERTKEIRARESLLQMVTNNIPVMIGYYDAARHLVFSNVQYARAFGHAQAAEVVGKHVSALMPPERLAMHQPHIERAFQGSTERYEFALTLDAHRQAEIMLVPDLRTDGSVQGVFVVLVDVTERRQAEAALRAADQRYRAVVANMREGVIVRDQHGKIIDCNPSAERMLGRTHEQLRGATSMVGTQDVFDEAGVPVPLQQRPPYAALHTGKAQSNVVLGHRNDAGEMRWLSSTSLPLFSAGTAEVTGTFSTFTDVTGRKQAEAEREYLEGQLRESQKMQAMGTLAGGIAHDFNNILGAILGNVALARAETLAGEVRVSLDEIHKGSERAKHLVGQILAFSRKQPQNFIDQPLGQVLEDTLGLLRATLPAGISIDARFDAAAVNVHADAAQIGQVLMNLCTNAWQAMAASTAAASGGAAGTVAVSLDQIEIDAVGAARLVEAVPGRYVRLTVADSGCGMDAATRERIFEPFFTTKPIGESTGLGLAVVHGIVKAHRGVIAVATAPGQGSTIEVLLPEAASQQPIAPATQRAGGLTHGAGKSVMYIDDEAAMVFLVKRMLTKSGYRVSAFERPAEALEALRADAASFDIIVTDFNMPGKSGLDVAREVAHIRANLPVVIASGYITDELRAGAAQLGVRDLIYKPDTVEELCRAIAQVLQAEQNSS